MSLPGTDVVIIDAGGANLGSVQAAFARLGVQPEVSRDPARIAAAARLVLPGVGAAAPVMATVKLLGAYAWRKMFDLDPFPEIEPPEPPPT